MQFDGFDAAGIHLLSTLTQQGVARYLEETQQHQRHAECQEQPENQPSPDPPDDLLPEARTVSTQQALTLSYRQPEEALDRLLVGIVGILKSQPLL